MNDKEWFQQEQMIDKAFRAFLKQIARKTEIEINYSNVVTRINRVDFAVIGYRIEGGWYHGLHYSSYNDFRFGHFDEEQGSIPLPLNQKHTSMIPTRIKLGLKKAIELKADVVMRNDKEE